MNPILKFGAIALFIASVFFTGCGLKGEAFAGEPELIIGFDLSEEPADIFSAGLLDDPLLLNLDGDSIPIGEIEQVIGFKDRIFLLSSNNNGSVIIFDDNGNFISHIQRVGRGPLEYIGIEGIFVDPETQMLGLYTRMYQKIIYFDTDGNVLTEVPMPKRFEYIWKTDTGYAGDMGNYGEDNDNRGNLWLMDHDFKPQRSFFEIPASWESKSLGNIRLFSDHGNKTYYIRPLDNNVYRIEKEGLTIPYRFSFGKADWPEPKAGYDRFKEIIRESPGRYVYRLDWFQETHRYAIVQFLHDGQTRLGVFDKQSGTSAVYHPSTYIGKYFLPFGKIAGMDSEAVYTVIEANDMKKIWDGGDQYNDFEADHPEQIRRLREDFPVIEEDGNPFLAIYRFK